MLEHIRDAKKYIAFFCVYSSTNVKKEFVFTIFITLAGACCVALSPIFLRYTTDSLSNTYDIFIWLGLYILCLTLGKVLSLIGAFSCREAIENLGLNLGGLFIEKTAIAGRNEPNKSSTEWVQLLQSAKNNNSSILYSTITIIFPLLGRLILSIMALCYFEDYLTSALLITYMLCCTLFNIRRIRTLSRKYSDAIDAGIHVSKVLGDTLGNLDTVKIYNAAAPILERYNLVGKRQRELHRDALKSNNFIDLTNAIVFVIVLIITLSYAAYRVVNGTATPGYFIMVNAFVYQVCQPLEGVLRVIASVSDSATSLKSQIIKLDILSLFSYTKSSSTTPKKEFLTPSVEFQNISFKYPDSLHSLISNVNFKIEVPSVMVIVGPSGSGKTTLLKLLHGNEKPIIGSVLINGEDTQSTGCIEIADTVCVVQQEPQLFNDTLRFNLKIAAPQASDENLLDALHECQMGAWFNTLPGGLDTQLGERGSKISGGEKQRLSLVRALLRNREIILIDEGTSGLDSTTEAHILKKISNLARKKIVIIVTHRYSTLSIADTVLVMESKKGAAFGTFSDMIKTNEYLARVTQSDPTLSIG